MKSKVPGVLGIHLPFRPTSKAMSRYAGVQDMMQNITSGDTIPTTMKEEAEEWANFNSSVAFLNN
jgi:hypothetical protein